MARRTPLGAVSLEMVNAKIDRKKLSLRNQMLKADRLVKKTGTTQQAAMISIGREQIASQATTTTKTSKPKKKFTSSGAPKRDPFGRQRRLDPKKITRRGGRQPKKR